MTFKDRLDRYRAEAKSAGIPQALIGPIPYQVLWAIGVPLTPPLHQSFLSRLLTVGIPAGLIFGFGIGLFPAEHEAMSPLKAAGAGAAFGLLFGAFWAILVVALKFKFNVPAWNDPEHPGD